MRKRVLIETLLGLIFGRNPLNVSVRFLECPMTARW